MKNVTHRGGCHCGLVRFEVDAPRTLEVDECNCSICARSGYLHLIVPRSRFRLIAGDERIEKYQFNTGTAEHLFCGRCGIKSFYKPRSHPDGFSVNARCLEPGLIDEIRVRLFDGVNWEENAPDLAPLGE